MGRTAIRNHKNCVHFKEIGRTGKYLCDNHKERILGDLNESCNEREAKNSIKSWPNVTYKTWEYKGQTENKHHVLGYYLPLWAQILSKWNKQINYIDGFSGIGAYHTIEDKKEGKYISENFGSPILVAKELRRLKGENRINDFRIVLIDQNQENLDNIKLILDNQGIELDKILFVEGDFDKEINNLIGDDKLYPTFFFIDPFGFKSIKFSTLKKLMDSGKCEIFLNFMYYAIRRFVKSPEKKILDHFDDYFGTKGREQYIDNPSIEKEEQLKSLFRVQCKQIANFVYPFKMEYEEKNGTIYYLFHLTNNYKGCSLMKDCFARCNLGNLEYNGKTIEKNPIKQTSLFDTENIKEKDDERVDYLMEILKRYKGKKISFVNLIKDIIDSVDLTESSIKKILQQLEIKELIEIISGRKRRQGIEDNDIIYFK